MMGSEWKEATLGEISNLKNGKGLKNFFYCEDGQYPVWGANGQIARTDELLNEQPVVVIGRVGAYCGSVHAVFEPNWVTDNAIVATPKEGHSFRFLYYFLKYLKPERTSIGSAQPLITQTGLKTLKHSVPPISEQRAIAHILGSLDDKIELNRKMNGTLEAMARAIFKSWFVDFDPVRARRGDPAWSPTKGADTKVCPYMTPEILNLFPDKFEDSELGEIPRGWEVGILGDVSSVRGGFAYKSKDFTDKGYPVVKIKNINTNKTVDLDNVQYVPETIANDTKSFWLNNGDLVMAMTGATIGKFGLIVNKQGALPALLNQRVAQFYANGNQ